MRFRYAALLGILILLTCSFSMWSKSASGQSAAVDIVESKLIEAFVQVQKADQQGASPSEISQLSNGLNLALVYEENATLLSGKNNTASYIYAGKSVNVSTTTTAQALNIASNARSQAFYGQVTGYSLAQVAAFGTALLVLEHHRFSNFFRTKRLRRVRFE